MIWFFLTVVAVSLTLRALLPRRERPVIGMTLTPAPRRDVERE